MKSYHIFIIAGLIFSLLGSIQLSHAAYAAVPSQIAPDVNTVPGDITYQLLDTGLHVNFASNPYSDEQYVYGDRVNFTNIALSRAGNPTQTFGISPQNGNATVSFIRTGDVVVTMSCANAAVCYETFYYPSTSPVYAIQANIGQGLYYARQASFYVNDLSGFNAATSPAFYQNTTGNYVKVKVTYTDPTILTFFINKSNQSFVYLDMGKSLTIDRVDIYKTNTTALPSNISIYVTDDLNNWGTAKVSNYSLSNSVGIEKITISSSQGRYVVLKVDDFGSATTFQISEISTEKVFDWGFGSSTDTAMTGFYVVMGIILVAIVVMIIKGVF